MTLTNNTMKIFKMNTVFYLLALSLYFGRFNINMGFSLKPFMIITGILIAFSYSKMKFDKLFPFELTMIIFILFHMMTALNFRYPQSSIRFIILYVIILLYYFSSRGLIRGIKIETLDSIISKTGLIGVTASLLYYLIGIYASGMSFFGNNLNYYGVMIDRSAPRLTGTVSDDPNIFVFYVTIYFFFTITNLGTKLNRLGCFLSIISIILTLSRGAYISIVIGLVIVFFTSKNIKDKLKGLMTVTFISILFYNYRDKFRINIINYILYRFSSLFSDGGSGRWTLWANAIETFLDNPMGIGINSIREYNLEHYSGGIYVHNSFIEVLVETGVVGGILYLLLWTLLFYYSTKIMLTNRKAVFIFIIFITMFIQMNGLSVIYNESFYFAILLLYRYSNEYLKRGKDVGA